MPKRRVAKTDYNVGWVCALPHEMAAAKCMLDEIHDDLEEQDTSDHNSYQLGRIHHHDIVIASLPAGVYGTTSAATVAKDMLRTFPSIRFGLMVGIGGAAPSSNHDIRLGDVVVSEPHGASGGVIQYDRGKVTQGGTLQRTGSLNSPPKILLTALGRLKAEHECSDPKISKYLNEIYEQYPRMKQNYGFPERSHDQLFQTAYEHPKSHETCEMCDPGAQVHRKPRNETDPQVHYGNIASSNQVMKDGVKRDQLREELDVLCFETEAAGLMLDFPCLVIRGICDYSDSHKNDKWQRYAAAVAAGFTKELLGLISADRVRQEKTIIQVSDSILHEIMSDVNVQLQQDAKRQESRYENDRQRACHQALKTSTYEQFKNKNPDRVPGTCRWVLENAKYAQWLQGQKDDLLWISADPGCGKSVLARSLVDKELRSTITQTVCYFFFKDNEEQDSLAAALCAILHQLFDAQPQLLQYAMPLWDKNGENLPSEVYDLWRTLVTAVNSQDAGRVIVIIDALDECRQKHLQILIRLLHSFYSESSRPASRSSCLKFLVTSRPYNEIEDGFQKIEPKLPMIRLHGEFENDKIHEEIDLVIRLEVASLANKNDLSQSTSQKLEQKLLSMEHRTYLWLHLAIEDIENTFGGSPQPDSVSIESLVLPTSVEEAYERILTRVPKFLKEMVAQIFHIIIGARRPLATSEMAIALGIHRRKGLQPFEKFKITEGRLKKKLRDWCGLFVFIDHSKIYFIHQTAKEFLLQTEPELLTNFWRHSINPGKSETMMAAICVEYLSLSEIQNIAESTHQPALEYGWIRDALQQAKTIKKQEIGALLLYSSEHWAAHFRNAGFDLQGSVILKARELCRVNGEIFHVWFPVLWQALRPHEGLIEMNDLGVVALNGHESILKIILNTESIDLEERDSDENTALIWASLEGHEKIVHTLLNQGANVNARGDELYHTALIAASANGHEEIVNMLLNKDADVNAGGEYYATALIAASAKGHEKIVNILLNKDADVNVQNGEYYGTALIAASGNGQEKIMNMLLNKGADVNASDDGDDTALIVASANGYENIVNILLSKGADVHAQGEHYGTALNAASIEGYEKIVDMLLNKGADMNVQSHPHGSALMAASKTNRENIVNMLLNKGADVNARYCGRYVTALIAASAKGHEKIVNILLNQNADIHVRSKIFGTALIAASEGGHEKIVNMLLNKGADVHARSDHFGTALNAASILQHENIVKILLSHGAKWDD